MSIKKQFWLSHHLLCQRLPNRGETVSLLYRFGGDPLHTHPKCHKFFSSTHQSLQKDSNSNHCVLSLEHRPKSSNLKGCDQTILEANQVWGSVHFDSISTNKERLTNTFPGYHHSRYHNLFQKFVSFTVQAFQLHIFLGTIEINSIVLVIRWYFKGKVLLPLKHKLW